MFMRISEIINSTVIVVCCYVLVICFSTYRKSLPSKFTEAVQVTQLTTAIKNQSLKFDDNC